MALPTGPSGFAFNVGHTAPRPAERKRAAPAFSFGDSATPGPGFFSGLSSTGTGSGSAALSFGPPSTGAGSGFPSFSEMLARKKRAREADAEDRAAKRAKTIGEESRSTELIDYTDQKARAHFFPDLHIVDSEGKTHYFHRLFLTEAVSPVFAAALAREVKTPVTLTFTSDTKLTQLILNCMQRGDCLTTVTLAQYRPGSELAALISFAFKYGWRILPELESAAVAQAASQRICGLVWEALREAKLNQRDYAEAYVHSAWEPPLLGAPPTAMDKLADFWPMCENVQTALQNHIYTAMRHHQYDEKRLQELVSRINLADCSEGMARAIAYSRVAEGVGYARLHNVLLGAALEQLQKSAARVKKMEPVYKFIGSAGGEAVEDIRRTFKVPRTRTE